MTRIAGTASADESPILHAAISCPSINANCWKSGSARSVASPSPAASVMFGSTPLQPIPYPAAGARSCVRNASSKPGYSISSPTHEIGRELKQISQWLDQHRPLLRLVSNDLRRDGARETGRRGLPAEAVLRCALLKQYRQLSYEELAFHLEDLASFRAFARLPMGWTPKKAVLQKTISAIICGQLGSDQPGGGVQRPANQARAGDDGSHRQHGH